MSVQFSEAHLDKAKEALVAHKAIRPTCTQEKYRAPSRHLMGNPEYTDEEMKEAIDAGIAMYDADWDAWYKKEQDIKAYISECERMLSVQRGFYHVF